MFALFNFTPYQDLFTHEEEHRRRSVPATVIIPRRIIRTVTATSVIIHARARRARRNRRLALAGGKEYHREQG